MPGATVPRDMRIGRPGPSGRISGLCRRILWVALATVVCGFLGSPMPAVGQEAGSPRPEEARLREVVETLASPEFGGRSGAGGDKAAAYLLDRFRALGLEPLFNGEFTQTIPGKEPGIR